MEKDIDALKKLSVINIMIDVVPGYGDGIEVYAQSVGDVELLFAKMSNEITQLEEKGGKAYEQGKRDALQPEYKNAAAFAKLQGALEELRKLYVDLTNGYQVAEDGSIVGYVILSTQLDRLEVLLNRALQQISNTESK